MVHDPVVAHVVYNVVAAYVATPLVELRPDHRLLADLQLDGDDYGMGIVPEIQKLLKFTAPREEWERVVTIQDVLDIGQRHFKDGAH